METAMDTDAILNALLDALLPDLNAALPKAIQDAGLDPWGTVAQGSDTLGKINLGLCTAKVKASYSIKDMTGLSSIEILSATVETSTTAASGTQATGTMALKARLNKSLSAKVSGKLSASCGGISESVKISGKITAKGVTGKGKGPYAATLGVPESCLQSLELSTFSLDYSSVDISIDGLGIFNSFLKPLEDVVTQLFKDAITTEVANAVKPLLNSLIADELPFCIGVTQVAGTETAAQSA
jgi:hypothetical protein